MLLRQGECDQRNYQALHKSEMLALSRVEPSFERKACSGRQSGGPGTKLWPLGIRFSPAVNIHGPIAATSQQLVASSLTMMQGLLLLVPDQSL